MDPTGTEYIKMLTAGFFFTVIRAISNFVRS